MIAVQPIKNVERIRLFGLIGAAILTIVLWQVPGGNYILYPFTIMATWFHEMAHGLVAFLLGGKFEKLMIFSNGSGIAYYSRPMLLEPISSFLVAAAGPMGPPLAGAGLIIASRNPKASSVILKFLGIFLIFSAMVWVRSIFGFVAILVMGSIVLGISFARSQGIRLFAVQFLGVQACVATYFQLDYLFSFSAGPLGISDTGRMQQILLLPYWFWAALMAVGSIVILIASLRIAYRS
ncbi:MAG: M50 family metallopeptidase [Desulfomonilaceae bacterium]